MQIRQLILLGTIGSSCCIPEHTSAEPSTRPNIPTPSKSHVAVRSTQSVEQNLLKAEGSPSRTVAELVLLLKKAETDTGTPRISYDEHGNIIGVMLSTITATDSDIRLLPRFPGVRRVKLNCPRSPITPEALSDLRKLEHLETLELRYAVEELSLPYVLAISELAELRALTVESSAIAPNVLPTLQSFAHLEKLSIRNSLKFSDADVVGLATLQQLREIDLTYTGITDKCLRILATLPKLELLTVSKTKVTEHAVLRAGLGERVRVVGARRD